MNFKRTAINLLLFQLVTSLLYGTLVFSFVNAWSFDYEAVVDTVNYFQRSEPSYIELLAFNSFFTYGLAQTLPNSDAEFIASFFFGISAALRFFVYSRLLCVFWFIPIFFSMAVMLDFNMSRYSLAVTFFVLIYGVWARSHFRNISMLKTILLMPFFFHLHHFSMAFIGLFSRTSLRFRIILISMIPFGVLTFSTVFSRFLSANADPFPRISLVYLVLSLLIVIGFKVSKTEFKPFATVVFLLMAFHLSGVQFNSAYYTRFSFLIFEVTLLTVALRTDAFTRQKQIIKYNNRYLKVLAVCSLSATYQVILVNGNIWRFF